MKAVGIDLGTTNSEVAIIENGQAKVLPGEDGELILPSCVGFSDQGKLLVGKEALRQYAAAPERSVKSIKRWMGTDHKTTLGDKEYLPQEISAMILRALKQRAENALGETVTQAVITVPAYFTDAQRQATKTAGEIAGFEVLQIINEPTAAALTYDLRSPNTEKVLVYDLGGGTFDVSIVEITGEVTEVLASHGNNRLGGDDFDRLLQLHLGDIFRQEHGVDVPTDAVTQARLLRAAEQLKMDLSFHAFATVREAFLGSKGKTALHLETELARGDFEKVITPLVEETLDAIDRALADAKLEPEQIDRIILVGGSTRIPLVQKMIAERLGQAPIDGIQPDLCVALGAALQAGVLTGEAVDSILVDVIPHSLGIAAVISTPMGDMSGYFSVIIPRNSVVPVSRSDVFSTFHDNQEEVIIEVFQGENIIAEENVPLGSFIIKNLPPKPAGEIEIEVHFDFDLNGILTVTSTEKGKGQQGILVVNNAGIERLSSHNLRQAQLELESLFSSDQTIEISAKSAEIAPELTALLDSAEKTMSTLNPEQAEELQELLAQIKTAMSQSSDILPDLQQELEDFLYYTTNTED
jgi:molecular chaperone DnaK